METNPTLRFSSRVENYGKYRPGYPQEIIATLQVECGLTPTSVVADIGSGTGFLAELFLKNGNPVFAVEPNQEMREASVRLLRAWAGFRSVDGRAEATNLAGRSIDFVVSGQAFHWFDLRKARSEFLRILKPAGWVMVVWNEREIASTAFLKAYEEMLQRYVADYPRLVHKQAYDVGISGFFGSDGFVARTFKYRQEFDFDGVKGRMLSSSYTPDVGHPNHVPLLGELSRIFKAHVANGRVTFEYTTRMYYGRLR
jgi:SAM-dependent methyltransferase